MDSDFSYLEMARDVISAGWALSLRSNAVCMVSLLLKTSWRSHLYPIGIHKYTPKQAESNNWTTHNNQMDLTVSGIFCEYTVFPFQWDQNELEQLLKNIFYSCSQPTCSELVIGACVCVGGLKGLRCRALAWIGWVRVSNFSLAFRVVDKHKAVLLINTECVWPAMRVVRAAVHWPGGTCSGWRPLKTQ